MEPNPRRWTLSQTELGSLRILAGGPLLDESCEKRIEEIVNRCARRRALEELYFINGQQRTMRPNVQGVDSNIINRRIQSVLSEEA